jgi:multiple sugar transport system substrate-binding protein
VQTEQVAKNPLLKPWVSAVAAARGRTSGGLGVKYPVISQQLWAAVQGALSGGKTPQSALAAAQSAAAK